MSEGKDIMSAAVEKLPVSSKQFLDDLAQAMKISIMLIARYSTFIDTVADAEFLVPAYLSLTDTKCSYLETFRKYLMTYYVTSHVRPDQDFFLSIQVFADRFDQINALTNKMCPKMEAAIEACMDAQFVITSTSEISKKQNRYLEIYRKYMETLALLKPASPAHGGPTPVDPSHDTSKNSKINRLAAKANSSASSEEDHESVVLEASERVHTGEVMGGDLVNL